MNVQKNTKQKSGGLFPQKSAPLNREKFSSAGFFSTEALGFFSSFGQRAPLNWKKYAEHIFIHNPRFLTAALLSALLLCLPQCTGARFSDARFSDAAPTCDVISGNIWESKTSGITEAINSVAALGGRLIAVGDLGTVITSDDKGESWTDRTSSVTETSLGDSGSLHSVAVSGERLIAVGVAGIAAGGVGKIFTSDDRGENWTDRSSTNPADLHSVAASKGTLIAVGQNGTILKSIDNGGTWSDKTVPGANTFFSVIPSLDSFLAFGTASQIYESTDDGDTWTDLSTPTFPGILLVPGDPLEDFRSFHDALGMGEKLTVVGGVGTIITSPDNGASWEIQESGALGEPNLWSVSSIGSRLVMVGDGGTIISSDDNAASRMARESGTTENILSVLGLGAGLGCYFIAVGRNGTVLVSKE